MRFSMILESKMAEKHHVTAFVRMNPPTAGHKKLLDKVHSTAAEYNASHSVVTSHTHDGKKNPLTPSQKVHWIKKLSPGTNVSASSPEHPNLLHHLSSLHSQGVTHLHMVAGSDRHEEFHNLISKYNGKKGPHGYFKFKGVKMHSAGERDPDAEGTEGVSGTSQRKHVQNDDRDSFHKGTGLKNKADSDKLFDQVKKGLKEETDMMGTDFGQFAGKLLNAAVIAHMYHLETHKYSTHMALDTLYQELPGLVDALVEMTQGKYGIQNIPVSSIEPTTKDPIIWLQEIKEYVAINRKLIYQDSEIQNSIDEIATLIDSTLYKLINLREEAMEKVDIFEAKDMELGDIDSKDLDPHTDDAYFLDVLLGRPPRSKAANDLGVRNGYEPNPNANIGEELELDEKAMDISHRLKAGQRMRQHAKRYAMLKKMKANRMAPADRLKYRARKAALMALRRKVAGQSGAKYSTMSPAQKMSIDQMVDRRYGSKIHAAVDKLSKRILPSIRKKEMDRLHKARGGKGAAQKMQTIQAGDYLEGPVIVERKTVLGSLPYVDKDGDRDNDVIDAANNAPGDTDADADKISMKLLHIGPENNVRLRRIHIRREETEYDDVSEARKKQVRKYVRSARADKNRETIDSGHYNVLNQLRKMRPTSSKTITWDDGSTSEFSLADRDRALAAHDKIINSGGGPGSYGADKHAFMALFGKNEKSHKLALGGKHTDRPVIAGFVSRRKGVDESFHTRDYKTAKHHGYLDATDPSGDSYVRGRNEPDDDVATQLRKHHHKNDVHVTWNDGSKSKLTPEHRRAALAKHTEAMSSRNPDYKQKFSAAFNKNEKSHMAAVHGKLPEPKKIAGFTVRESAQPGQIGNETSKIRRLINLGKDDPKTKTMTHIALRHGDNAMKNPTDRKYIGDFLNKLLALADKDPQLFSILQKNMQKESVDALTRKAITCDIPVEVIAEVFVRGCRAYDETCFNKHMTMEQFAFARVNSFVAGGYAANLDGDMTQLVENAKAHFAASEKARGDALKQHPIFTGKPSTPESRKKISDLMYKEKSQYDEAVHTGDTKLVWVEGRNGKKIQRRVPVSVNEASPLKQAIRAGEGKPNDRRGLKDGSAAASVLEPAHEDFDVASHCVDLPKPWENDSAETVDSGKTPKTWMDIRQALSGKAVKESKNADAPFDPDPPKKNPRGTGGPQASAKWLAKAAVKKVLKDK